MSRRLRIIQQIVISYLNSALIHRLDFLQNISASVMWSTFSFVSAFLITSRTPAVLGLERRDLLLLAATYGVVVGLHHWLCTKGFGGFATIIHRGELDGFLLKPFDELTHLSLRNISWGSFPRFIASMFLTALIVRLYEFPVTLESVLFFVFLSLVAFLIIYSFYTLSCTVLIWHPYLSNIVDFVGNATGASRYPIEVTHYSPRPLSLLFLPFLAIVNVPTLALVNRLSLVNGLLFTVSGFLFFFFARWCWRQALWHYTGASS